MTVRAATENLPDDPTLVALIAAGEVGQITLPFRGSVRARDGLMTVAGLVAVNLLQGAEVRDLLTLAEGLFAIALLGMIAAAVAEYRDWRRTRDEHHIPLAIRDLDLGRMVISDVLLLLGILVTGVGGTLGAFVGHGLVLGAIVVYWRTVRPVTARAMAAYHHAILLAQRDGIEPPRGT